MGVFSRPLNPATPALIATPAPNAEGRDPAVREAVSQVSSAVLASLLLVLIVSCVLVLLGLRRRSRQQRAKRVHGTASDAWSESARRVDLEVHPDIPREPGTE